MSASEVKAAGGLLEIVILCPHRLLREGLRLVMEQDAGVGVLAAAGEAEDLEPVLRGAAPRVLVLVDAGHGSTCADQVRRVRAGHPGVPVLVLSTNVEAGRIQQVVTAGATAYLPLDVDLDDLVRSIRTAARGELSIHRSLVPSYLRFLASGADAPEASGTSTPSFEDLSPREREVLELLADGLGDRDIGQELFISVRTVQTHLSHIYDKLGVHTRTEAALLAVREGWVS